MSVLSSRLKDRWVRKRNEYLSIQNSGYRIHLQHFLFFILQSSLESDSRLGITVSRRVGNAVVRNRLKRQLREVWRLKSDGTPKGLDIVVIAKKSAAEVTFDDLRDQFELFEAKIRKRYSS